MDIPAKIISRHSGIDRLLQDNQRNLHPGLLFQRFARIFAEERCKGEPTFKQERLSRLNEFCEIWSKNSINSADRLRHVHSRLSSLIVAENGQEKKFLTDGRMAIGLGNVDPSDIGFHFDHDTGMPSIPGSSVKGLALAGARLAGVDDETMKLYFGYQTEVNQGGNIGAIGNVIFLGAIPTDIPKVEIDIITCHHNYEKLSSQKTPLDCDSPVPVHFLTIDSGSSFTFRILPRKQGKRVDLEKVWDWLTLSLENLGAGGKTAVGYGSLISADRTDEIAAIKTTSSTSKSNPITSFKRGDRLKVQRIEDPKGKNREVFDVPGGYKGYLKSGSTDTNIGDETELYIYSVIDSQGVITFSLNPV